MSSSTASPSPSKSTASNKDKTWTLEAVDHEGTSHVWDEQFASDKDARNTAIQAIYAKGAIAFMRGDNVIPFRKAQYGVGLEQRLALFYGFRAILILSGHYPTGFARGLPPPADWG